MKSNNSAKKSTVPFSRFVKDKSLRDSVDIRMIPGTSILDLTQIEEFDTAANRESEHDLKSDERCRRNEKQVLSGLTIDNRCSGAKPNLDDRLKPSSDSISIPVIPGTSILDLTQAAAVEYSSQQNGCTKVSEERCEQAKRQLLAGQRTQRFTATCSRCVKDKSSRNSDSIRMIPGTSVLDLTQNEDFKSAADSDSEQELTVEYSSQQYGCKKVSEERCEQAERQLLAEQTTVFAKSGANLKSTVRSTIPHAHDHVGEY